MEQQEISDQLFELIQVTTQLTTQVAEMQKSLAKLESITPSVILHEEQINQIKVSLQRGNDKFDKFDKLHEKLDERIDKLEHQEGDKAKKIFATVGSYLLVTIAAAILSNIGNIIAAFSK